MRIPTFVRIAATMLILAVVAVNQTVCGAEAVGAPASAIGARTFRSQVDAALERSDLPAAWIAMRAWVEAVPSDPAARLAEAELYLRLNAPAAAIGAADTGLGALTDTTRKLERPLQAVKAQAHLAVGETAPAWAAYSRVLATAAPAESGDPLIRAVRRARWDAYAQIDGIDAYAGFVARVAAGAAPGASVAAQVRLARWIVFTGHLEDARQLLRTALGARPEARELKVALADLALAAAASEAASGGEADTRAEFALLSADPALDPLAHTLLAALHLSDATEPPPAAPRDYPLVVSGLVGTLPARRAEFDRAIARATSTLEKSIVRPAFPGDDAAPAQFSAWEKTVVAEVRALRENLVAQDRSERMLRFLAEDLAAKVAALPPSAPSLPALRTAVTQLQTLAPPEGEPGLRTQATSVIKDALLAASTARANRHKAEARAALVAGSPAQILAATEDALAVGEHSSVMWRARFDAALALGDPTEALASGARAFVAEWMMPDTDLNRELPPATGALLEKLEKLVAEAPALVIQAVAAWEAGNANDALTRLDRALALDPASAAAWRLRAKWSEACGDDRAAALALDRWWRLDDGTAWDPVVAFGLASRAGAWELLLSLADARLARAPQDADAHFFRACSALACDRFAVARESLAMIEFSRHRDIGRLLALIIHTLTSAADAGTRALSDATELFYGSRPPPRGLAEWCAYHDRLQRGGAPGTAPDRQLAERSTVHQTWLDGRLPTADYIARTRGTAEESMARFVQALVARLPVATPATTSALASAAEDPQLPLALRAAARLLHRREAKTPAAPALRASDLYYASSAPASGAEWGALGQEVVVTAEADADTMPAPRPVRLRGVLGSASAIKISNRPPDDQPAIPRLWELRNLRARVTGNAPAGGPPARAIVECVDVEFSPVAAPTIEGAAPRIRTTASGNSLITLRATLALQARTEQWREAARRFERDFSSATAPAAREQAVSALAQAIGDTGRLTGATSAESTRAMIDAVLPALQRYPREVPALFAAASPSGVGNMEIWRERMPDNLKDNLKKYAQSFDLADRLSRSTGNKVSVDVAYGFAVAYPPGSRDYAAAQDALRRGLTTTQFEAELATRRKRDAELAVAGEKRRKEEAARQAEAARRPEIHARRTPDIINSSDYTLPSGPERSYSVPTLRLPAWKPSETYQMQVYRHNLDVQITRAVRGY